MKKFTVGLVLGSTSLPKPTMELVEWLENNPKIKLNKFFLQRDVLSSNSINKRIWGLIKYLEKIFYSQYFKHYSDIPLDLNQCTLLNNAAIHSKNFVETEDYQIIKSKNIDLFFSLNFNISTANLCELSRYGLLSIHTHPNTETNNFPQAFAEVLFKSNKTGFSLIHQKRSNSDIRLVFQGAFPTHNYYFANNINLLKRRNIYIQNLVSFFIKSTSVKKCKLIDN